MKTDRFSEMGIASLIPGMQYMIDEMQERLNSMKQTLVAYQEQREEGLRRVAQQVNREFGFDPKRGQFVEPKRRGRPPGVKDGRGQWRTKSGRLMTAEERRVESRRRRAKWKNPQALAQASRTANHPRNPDHPDHAAWLKKIQKAQQARWNNMSAAAQKKQIKKMVAARVNGAATEAASS